jgi:hypothetical protein
MLRLAGLCRASRLELASDAATGRLCRASRLELANDAAAALAAPSVPREPS